MQRNFIVCLLVLIAAVPQLAFARATNFRPMENVFPPTVLPSENIVSEDKPVMVSADTVEYLQQEDKVVASGHVEVVQGETMILADRLVYERSKNLVNAIGNVSVMDETGSVVFADEVELRDDMHDGVIDQFKMRLTDDSLFAAERAVKVDENIIKMDNAVYSPCKVKCQDDLKPGEKPRDPLWQLRADEVTINQEEENVSYKNAYMELYGMPVLYTPYMSHATPNAGNKSGIMVPEFKRSDDLGNMYTVPVYWAISPDKDMVITPTKTSKEGMLFKNSYRQKFDKGFWNVEGSITNPRSRDNLGNLTQGHDLRGHFYTFARFEEDPDTSWGFDIKRTTDDTYLRKYDIDGQTLLISQVQGEKYDFVGDNDRNSLTAEAVAFQGLTVGDDSKRIPLILPLVHFDYESDPGIYGSRYYIDSNALMLTRDIGSQTKRLSNTLGWRLPVITEGGQMIEFDTHLRGDIYQVSDVLLANGRTFDGITGRVVPEASMLWRYPFINQIGATSVMFEPVVNAAISPNGGNPEKIPNEDSLVPEFTDTNLFSNDRFAGYDRIEHGPRVSYGLRGLVNYEKAYVDWLLGQHYRVQEDRNFPFSNDIQDHLSDYVGKVGLQYNPFYLAYRFRLDKERLSARRREIDLSYTANRLNLTAAYLLLQNDPVFASREELVSNASLNVTKNWLVGAGFRRDLEIGQVTNVGAQLVYKNECVNISSVISREYTRDRELKPRTSYLIQISLKNLE
jgi:LPS-assembly protein